MNDLETKLYDDIFKLINKYRKKGVSEHKVISSLGINLAYWLSEENYENPNHVDEIFDYLKSRVEIFSKFKKSLKVHIEK